MIRCDGLDTYVEFSDRIFHWVLAEGLPEPKPSSPQEFRLRRYTKKCVRFASRKIKDLALITLDLSKLADVALACLDDCQQSTGYWVELLSFRCLQVKLTSSCLWPNTEMIGCCVGNRALLCILRSEGCVIESA